MVTVTCQKHGNALLMQLALNVTYSCQIINVFGFTPIIVRLFACIIVWFKYIQAWNGQCYLSKVWQCTFLTV